jgi:hypothetical protein
MTKYQVQKISELLKEGWTVVPIPDENESSASNVKDPKGVVYSVNGDGSLSKL